MLEWLRKYQRYIYIVVTVLVVASFSFFGTFTTFMDGEKRVDRVIGQAIDGSPIHFWEVKQLSHFLASDREDVEQRGVVPNWLNDGVIRNDFLRTRLAELLVEAYFEPLKEDLEARLQKAKRYRPYVHHEAPYLSARLMWQRFLPAVNTELDALVDEKSASPSVFFHFATLYQQQGYFHPELLRRILVYQHQQYPQLHMDPRLQYEDLSLFGFHTTLDWFGQNFLDLVAEFILNGAAAAAEKGYKVSLEEAKGDLIHNFHQSLQKARNKNITYGEHLRMLGLDENSAAEMWRKVLLFRRYFGDVGEATFIDRLTYKGFSGFAHEVAKIQAYEWPIRLNSKEEISQFETYLKAIAVPGNGLQPKSFRTVEEVAIDHPGLVQTVYKAKVAELTKAQVGLRASLKEVWDWELSHWDQLKKEFSFLPLEKSFQSLEKLNGEQKAKIDAFAREALVDQNPHWIEDAIAAAPTVEKTFAVKGNMVEIAHIEKGDRFVKYLERCEEPETVAALQLYTDDGKHYFRFEGIEVIEGRHVLTFEMAKPYLPKGKEDFSGKNRFAAATEEAYLALQKDKEDSSWIGQTGDRIADQFKLRKKELSIQRTSKEDWMKEQVFLMIPNQWSPIHVAEDSSVVFFYLEERKEGVPILDQLTLGKETLSADAKRYLAERLLESAKKRKAIVLPVQGEIE